MISTIILWLGGVLFSFQGAWSQPTSPSADSIGSVFLKLLEPIAPQRVKDSTLSSQDTDQKHQEETVSSTLGDLLKDPKNESLKAVKVLGKQKRLKTAQSSLTYVQWSEVALEIGKRDGLEPSLLKEPVEKPLESSFRQKADTIEAGTPIEAKGDINSLLAAARTLMIKASKQDIKGKALDSKNNQEFAPFAAGQNSPPSLQSQPQHLMAPNIPSEKEQKPEANQGQKATEQQTFSEEPPRFLRQRQGYQSHSPSAGRDSPQAANFKTSHQASPRGSRPNTEGENSSPPSKEVAKTTTGAETKTSTNHNLAEKQTDSAPFLEGKVETSGGKQPTPSLNQKQTDPTPEENDNPTPTPGGLASSLVGQGQGLKPFLDHEQEDAKEGDFLNEQKIFQAGQAADIPVIRIDYEEQGCSPRIDWASKQVVIQAKALTFRNGEKVSETECLDTNKKFAIQKDYTHKDCLDQVDKNIQPHSPQELGLVYATYRPYWLNEAQERVYLKEPQRDEKYPFALQEEEGQCSYALDLKTKQAKPQSDLVYYNRFKQRVVVEPCRPSVFGKITPLRVTSKGCGWVHQFDKHRSIQQHRFIYTVQGIEREASPCQDTGEWVGHQFDRSVCKPVVDALTKKHQPFAKRYIVTDQGRLTLSECEPYGEQLTLKMDEEACQHQPYHHDLESGQSYVNVRWYYEQPYGRKYVTACQPSTQTFAHKKTLLGYVHEDARQLSRPKIEISFSHQGRKIVVATKIDKLTSASSYARLREEAETRPYQQTMQDRCYQQCHYRQHAIYRRVDGTEIKIPVQDRVAARDLCQRKKEVIYEHVGVTWFGYMTGNQDNFYIFKDKDIRDYPWGKGMFHGYPVESGYTPLAVSANLWTYYNQGRHRFPERGYLWNTSKVLERTVTLYPDKSTEATEWQWDGTYFDQNPIVCAEGGGGDLPYQEKVWGPSERVFAEYR